MAKEQKITTESASVIISPHAEAVAFIKAFKVTGRLLVFCHLSCGSERTKQLSCVQHVWHLTRQHS